MKKQLYAMMIFIAPLVTQGHLLQGAIPAGKVKHITSDVDFNNAIKDTEKFKIIDFYADWCGACKMSAPHFEEVAQEDGRPDVIYLKVNTDHAPQTAATYRIEALPTFVVLGKDNVQSHSERGAGSKSSMKTMIDRGIDAAKSGKQAPATERRRIDDKESYGDAVVEHRQLPAGSVAGSPPYGKNNSKPMPVGKPTQMPAEKQPNMESKIVFVDTPDEYVAAVLSSGIPTVIHFSVKNCKTCEHLDTVLEALALELQGRVQFVDVEVDNTSLRGITGKAGLLALPNHDWLWTDMSRDFNKKDEANLRSKISSLASQVHTSRADKKAKQR